MGLETDVLIIGGGATGTGVARDLAMRGLDTILVEEGALSSGTTGRSHSLLHSGARYVPDDPASAEACVQENQILTEIAGHCVDNTGGLFVQLTGDSEEYFERKVQACHDHGIETEVLSGEAARKTVPALSSDVERAIRVPDGVIYPSRLTAATAVSAREHGAKITTQAPLTDLHVANDRVTGGTISLENGTTETIDAAHVVNATGAWAGAVAKLADLDVGMRPSRGVMVVVEFDGLDTVLNRCRSPADGDIIVPHDERVILGTTSEKVTDPDDYPKEDWEVDRVLEECTAMLPEINADQILRTYWGVRPLYGQPTETDDERDISRGFTLLDHAERDDTAGFTSIVGGKLTTHRRMAEAVSDHVCDRLGVTAECHTATEPLPGSDDPSVLDRFVEEFGGSVPSDADVVDI
ncbi:FAD-dependent oxidoreductase [Halocatena pleomorpha]|uniref:Glycerol-3-phosphate dehydrogenase n=1 Tax=Halocatena pleomorpha TaxID=1785090 RepID=A0A3P3RDD2_9EURY|nr:FAD-dependent oxidoreductase [Halocatena pleomorpha]RRJ31431.1 FAD-dependent oxidoreductase [Halocatena pleomorpha]